MMLGLKFPGIISFFIFILAIERCNFTITFPNNEGNDQLGRFHDSPGQTSRYGDGALNLMIRTLEDAINDNRNAVLSPTSVYLCLLLLYFGAKGDTKNELSTIIGNAASSNAFKDVASLPDVHSATATFVDTQTTVLPSYAEAIQQAIYSLDFVDGINSRDSINRWVSEQTFGAIPSLLDEPMDASTRAVAVSALHFNGSWMYPFSLTATKIGKFEITPEFSVDVPLMTTEASLPIYRTSTFRAVGLPYSNNGFTFYLVLPEISGLRALKNVAKYLTPESIEEMVANSRVEPVIVTLPKLQLGFKLRLKPFLQRHGVNKMFDRNNADFTNLVFDNNDPKLFVSDVYHSSHIEIDEGGTRASAATATVLTKSSRWVFRANRPFIFFIRHQSGQILFIGSVLDPTSTSS